VAALKWNGWQLSAGFGGSFAPEYAICPILNLIRLDKNKKQEIEMDRFIEIRKASMYFEDRDAVIRADRVFCFIKRFANEYDLDGQSIEDFIGNLEESDGGEEEPDEANYLDEVYLSGFCEIKFVSMAEINDYRLMEEGFNPALMLFDGTINGKVCVDQNRLFTTDVYTDEVYVSQADLDAVSELYGIPKRDDFKETYLKTIEEIKNEYSFLDHLIFYPDEVNELDEMNEFYGEVDSEDSKQQADLVSSPQEKKPNFNSFYYAVDREQVLGCLLALMVKDTKLGRNEQGKLDATKLREAVLANARFFWKKGNPPLSGDAIYNQIRKWLSFSPDKASEPKPRFSGEKTKASRKPWPT
jgi:hypothetical protein